MGARESKSRGAHEGYRDDEPRCPRPHRPVERNKIKQRHGRVRQVKSEDNYENEGRKGTHGRTEERRRGASPAAESLGRAARRGGRLLPEGKRERTRVPPARARGRQPRPAGAEGVAGDKQLRRSGRELGEDTRRPGRRRCCHAAEELRDGRSGGRRAACQR